MIDPYAFIRPRRSDESSYAGQDDMVASLPTTGGTVIVITNEVGRYLMKCIRHYRGFGVRKQWRFVAVRYFDDCSKMAGLTGQVFIDNSFTDYAKPEAQAEVRVLAGQIRAMYV